MCEHWQLMHSFKEHQISIQNRVYTQRYVYGHVKHTSWISPQAFG